VYSTLKFSLQNIYDEIRLIYFFHADVESEGARYFAIFTYLDTEFDSEEERDGAEELQNSETSHVPTVEESGTCHAKNLSENARWCTNGN
jgi:hypothetical protein